MKELNPRKLHVTFQGAASANDLSLYRRYTLTHSDFTGDLFLTIGPDFSWKQISGLYTRLMRDEVLAELKHDEAGTVLHVYCHVSGGLVFGSARWRFDIFHHHLRMVLEALRYGDRELVSSHPEINRSAVVVHFASNHKGYDCLENWGAFQDYE